MSAPMARMVGSRYQLRGEPIGRGGMGVVYRAYDMSTQREVALKTLKGVEPMAVELFRKEWTVLAQLSHPNIVDIIDSGEFEEDGQKKPYFVMPLLPGVTLDQLIRTASPRLTIARVIEMMAQTCKGLQAAHDRGIIHRDLKPSNLFVMEDDSVKVIDFGVVHLAEGQSVAGIKGSLPYMAPELLQLKAATPASDVFALAVVCYEALAGRNPFLRSSEPDTIQALRRYIPPPVSEVNGNANELIGRVLHKAMAKQPAYRFGSAREFGGALQRAFRNEPVEGFDRVKLGPRIERIKKACGEGDYQFAAEIIAEVESEGHIDPEINVLRGQVDMAMRQKSVRQLLDSARVRLEEEEMPLALQKIQEALEIDPSNMEAKLLRAETEQRRGARQIESWRRLVRQHMDNHVYSQARQALEEILKLDPTDANAREMLASLNRREQEFLAGRKQKEGLYQSAMRAYQDGEISSALDKLEHVLKLTGETSSSASPDRDAEYQRFYNQVRTERDEYRNAHAEGRRLLAERNFDAALELCGQVLRKYPGDALFQALKLEVEELQRQEQSAFLGDVNRRVDAEADLDRKYAILSEAAERFPKEPHYQQALRLIRERRDLVNAITAKARQYEERGLYSEALAQWDILHNIYGQYPGLQFEIERLERRRQGRVREEAKARWVQQIDAQLAAGEYERAQDLVAGALAESPGDRELVGLERLAKQGMERSSEARGCLQEGQTLCAERRFEEGIAKLQKARELDPRNPGIRTALVHVLLDQARAVINQDWHAAEPLVRQALDLDPHHAMAKNLRDLVNDFQRQERVEELICQARELQASGQIEAAFESVEKGLATYPNDLRLSQLRTTLRNALPESRRKEMREQFLLQLKALVVRIDEAPPEEAGSLVEQSRVLAEKYPEDAEFRAMATEIDRRAQNSIARQRGLALDETAAMATQTLAPRPAASAPSPAAIVPAAAPPSPRSGLPGPVHRLWNVLSPRLEPVRRMVRPVPPLIWGVAGTAIALVILGLIFRNPPRHVKPPAPQIQVDLDIRADVPGVNYNFEPKATGSKLGVGTYHIEAIADGYITGKQDVTVTPKTPSPVVVSFHMEPEPVRLQLNSNLASGKVSIDYQPEETLQEGGFSRDNLAPGPHTVKVMDGDREVLTFAFTAKPGEMAVLDGPPKAAEAQAIVLSSFVNRARVYASGTIQAAGKDQPLAPLPPDGLPLDRLNPGNAEASIDDGKGARPYPIDLGNAPRLVVTLTSARGGQKMAFLSIKANVPDAQVFIDDKPKRDRLREDGTRTYTVTPGPHRVRVSAPDYEQAEAQSVDVAERGTPTVTFTLQRVVNTSTLVIEGGTPDAEVLIGDTVVGKIQADGSFRYTQVAPGSPRVVIRKQNFEDVQETHQFTAKQTVTMNGKLKPLGTLVFQITPPNATITYAVAGANPVTVDGNRPISVKAGTYEVTARAPGRESKRETVTVQPGQSQSVTWTLTEVTNHMPPPPPPPPVGVFDETWKAGADGWWAHSGQGYGWINRPSGTFDIELRKPKKFIAIKGHVEWAVDYQNESNQVHYSWDGDNVTRKESPAGKSKDAKHPLKAEGGGIHFQLDIAADKIVLRQNGKVVDELTRSNAPQNKFGFKGDVEVKVSRR
jgi:tetratricopeptide (TPR) repeat protein